MNIEFERSVDKGSLFKYIMWNSEGGEAETTDVIFTLLNVCQTLQKQIEEDSFELHTKEYGNITVCDKDSLLETLGDYRTMKKFLLKETSKYEKEGL